MMKKEECKIERRTPKQEQKIEKIEYRNRKTINKTD